MATIVSEAQGASGAARWSADQEALLVDGLRAGRRDAFEQLYERYRMRIYNLTLRIVQSPEDACDITQDVFIKAFRKLPESPVSGPHLTPWLYRVAVNASYDHLRTRKQHGDIDDLNSDAPAMPIDTFEQAEMGRRVEQTLAGLSERHRTVLILKDIHGLRHDEMAEILDVSRGATETLLFRAREAFRTRYLELTQSQPVSRDIEKWSAAGIGIGMVLHEAPLPAALHGGFPFAAAVAGGAAGAGAAAGAGGAAGGGAAGASVASASASGASAGATAAGAAAGGAGAAGSSAGLSLAAGGLLAKVGGVAAVKLAAVVVAATCAAGGGVAAYEAGVLPRVHHKPAGPPAQAQAHKDEKAAGKAAGKTAGASARNDSASLAGAARSTAARERAAEKKAAKARERAAGKADRAATPGRAHGESGEQGSSSGNGAGAANATKGGSSASGGSANAGNQGGNAGAQSAKPDTPDRPDKPGKND